MPLVELSVTPRPTHVRTVRLMAVLLARRAGLDEGTLDEIRLAVGEAASRAVGVHLTLDPAAEVRVRLADDHGRFEVSVIDCGPVGSAIRADLEALPTVAVDDDGDSSATLPPGVGLAIITGLVDDMSVSPGSDVAVGLGGTAVTMRWALPTPS